MANMTPSSKCSNCGVTLSGRFCHECGQSNRYRRLDLVQLFKDLWAYLSNVESGFWRTLWGLFVAPGRVASEYVAGRRKTYFNPAGYYLLIGGLSVGINAWLSPIGLGAGSGILVEMFGGMAAVHGPGETGMDRSLSIERALNFVEDHYLQASLAALIVLVPVWRKLFQKSGYNLAEIAVFGLYVSAQLNLITAVVNVALRWSPVVGVGLFVTLFYSAYAGAPFFKEGYVVTFFKMFAAYLMFALVLFLILAIFLTLLD